MVRWTPEDPRVLRILIAAVALAAAHPSLASERGPSTPEERKRAVETTRKLEKSPLARSSVEARRWLFQWIVDIPDIHVTSCSGPLDPLLKQEDDPYAQLLYVQSVFGMTAWLIENPKKADGLGLGADGGARERAEGVRGALEVGPRGDLRRAGPRREDAEGREAQGARAEGDGEVRRAPERHGACAERRDLAVPGAGWGWET